MHGGFTVLPLCPGLWYPGKTVNPPDIDRVSTVYPPGIHRVSTLHPSTVYPAIPFRRPCMYSMPVRKPYVSTFVYDVRMIHRVSTLCARACFVSLVCVCAQPTIRYIV